MCVYMVMYTFFYTCSAPPLQVIGVSATARIDYRINPLTPIDIDG